MHVAMRFRITFIVNCNIEIYLICVMVEKKATLTKITRVKY